MKRFQERIKELTKLIEQLNKLLIQIISLVGWVLIIIRLLE